MGALFNLILINPTVNALLIFLFVFHQLRIPGALGFAIIALTSSIRLLFNPLYQNQMKMAKEMELIRPELDKLSKQYKNDKQKLQQAQLKLYQDRGLNPASGCLGAIIQIPIFLALYQVLRMFLLGSSKSVVLKVNELAYLPVIKIAQLDPHFLGFNLSVSPSQYKEFGWHYLLIPLITGALQYFQVIYQQGTPVKTEIKKIDGKTGEQKPEDFQKMMAKQMKIMFPLMIGYFSYILPVGLALYWNVFSLFTIFQAKSKTWKKNKK
ncbi:hypothetical protein A3F34_00440 [Candidatus Roizmanbacteria bacterium RIFCSPHIGHO2_12_FULL_44_10]|uniref:Membrane insertase YidC/Oxa/ALB C-terminal domain-containing protein n=1 Tax=Candidatus Roizmanbacteria bacterium RIFCSPHIGHO2_12_FULL_44_10 TaxID=1802054 RepID=A0A1F7I753_9BACT|nr:MAG: hypothetical protein A3F34_00440 [Candidatus Roizmanbacteria bacterium RIFCSPHIGHO2_12_FULL_44_10]